MREGAWIQWIALAWANLRTAIGAMAVGLVERLHDATEVAPWPGKLTALLGGIMAGVCTVLGGWTPAMTTLITLAALDVVSGFSRAAIQQKLSSKESWRGGIRKVLMFVIIALGAQADALLRESGVSIANGELVRNAAVIFYCVSEGLSIVENVVGAGLPVPQAIKDALAQLSEGKIEEPEGG